MKRWLVVTAALLLPATVAAQTPPIVTYPTGDDNIVVVRKGEAVPFNGQLYNDDTALRWAFWLRQYKERYTLDMNAAQAGCKVDLTHAAELYKIQADHDAAVNKDAMERLKASETARLAAEEELRSPSFFRSNGFWFGVGIATSLLTATIATYALNKAAR